MICAFRQQCLGQPVSPTGYCAVHDPEKILERIERILFQDFAQAVREERPDLVKLHESILTHVRSTV